MSERAREITGLVIVAVGVAVIPLGWYFSRLLWAAAAVLVVVGLILMLTDRVMEREREIANTPAYYVPPSKPSVPADVHNYSGWRDGGRSMGDGDSASDGGD
jgi:hypothetical protein